jgi:ubiquinone/menaquinone biosynthesis C-methylase UbiE
MCADINEGDYQEKLAAESKKWGEHLKVEAAGEWNAWTDHPLIREHYVERSLIDGLTWDHWVKAQFQGPAESSLDLGCGAGMRSIAVFKAGASKRIEGFDVSEERIAEGERIRRELGAPGQFRVADTNTLELPAAAYDLIFSAHSFHHFLELEHVCEQVVRALTPRGLFILEEFVGPTQFQWTDQQIDVVRSLMSLMPERLRVLPWGAVKFMEGRPTVEDVVAASPFESIRSAEIYPIFKQYFEVVAVRNLGGTLQHLLYNGIAHNFRLDDEEALRVMRAVWEVEDALVDSEMLPSDFMLLVGRRKDAA